MGDLKTLKLLRLANTCGANNKNPMPIRRWWEFVMNPFACSLAMCHYKYNCWKYGRVFWALIHPLGRNATFIIKTCVVLESNPWRGMDNTRKGWGVHPLANHVTCVHESSCMVEFDSVTFWSEHKCNGTQATTWWYWLPQLNLQINVPSLEALSYGRWVLTGSIS